MPKLLALWLIPALTAGLLVTFAALPQIDPLRENRSRRKPQYPNCGGESSRFSAGKMSSYRLLTTLALLSAYSHGFVPSAWTNRIAPTAMPTRTSATGNAASRPVERYDTQICTGSVRG